MSAPPEFVAESCRYLRDVYLPRLEGALADLSEADLWWRPHEGVLTIGTILRHLEGNVRQWIVSALGGEPDARDRAAEFAATGGASKAELLARLRATVERAGEVLLRLDAAALAARHSIQGGDVTAQQAVYHVVEHFSWHTGQATWIAKALLGPGHGIAFYDDARLDAAKNG